MNEIIKALSEALSKAEKYDQMKIYANSIVEERDGFKKKLREIESEKDGIERDLRIERRKLENAVKA